MTTDCVSISKPQEGSKLHHVNSFQRPSRVWLRVAYPTENIWNQQGSLSQPSFPPKHHNYFQASCPLFRLPTGHHGPRVKLPSPCLQLYLSARKTGKLPLVTTSQNGGIIRTRRRQAPRKLYIRDMGASPLPSG